jgi:hypothetical protein
VGDEIEREVERRNAADRAARYAPKQREAPLRARQLIRRQYVAAEHSRLRRTEPKRAGGARYLGLRVAKRLARLARDEQRELVLLGFDEQRESLEHSRALVGGTARPAFEGRGGAADGSFEQRRIREPHFSRQRRVVRTSHLVRGGRGDALAADVRVLERRRHRVRTISRARGTMCAEAENSLRADG